ncbi:MAG: ferritin family protein [Candidatus Omnitrophica bacterium]|nr:ferritin family protein [Candidatus Omnitrophota bacterium]
MNILHIAEIVDSGIEKEKKRRDFYALAAQKFNHQELKALFLQLAQWEETHITKFSAIRASLQDDTAAESYPGELTEYMQSLVSDKLYQDVTPASFAQKVASVKDALIYGISFEKDAILFFSELLNYTADPQKKVIQQLIDEEKQHIVFLALLLEKNSQTAT